MSLERREEGEKERKRGGRKKGDYRGILEGGEQKGKRGYYEVYLNIFKYILRSEKLSR